MNALSHNFDLSRSAMMPQAAQPDRQQPAISALVAQWDAVHDAAKAVGILAQLGEEERDEDILTLPERVAAMDEAQKTLVMRGIDDLSAVLQPGLRALLSLDAKGHDTTSAALTLWREFHTARGAILAIADRK